MTDQDYGGKTIARALQNDGVECMFGVIGAMDLVCEEGERLGIKHYVTRHEQAGGFAADGYARSVRRPGVTFTSNGPGLANVVPGMMHAKGANSPVVLLGGSLAPAEEGMGPGQEGYPAALLQDVCKWTHRIVDPTTLAFWVRRALRDSVQPTPGPIALDLPGNMLSLRKTGEQRRYVESSRAPIPPMTAGDPAEVRRVVELLARAERPVIIAGDGVYWSDAASELLELAELLEIPTCTRRTARGAVPESHPLAFTPTYRRGFLEDADVVCLIGQPVTSMDEWFEPPDWNHSASWIQIQDTPSDIWYALPTEVAVVGSSKLVLRQMIADAKEMSAAGENTVSRSAWIGALALAKARVAERRAKALERVASTQPIHPDRLCAEIANVLDESSTVIYDSFTASHSMTTAMEAQRAGQILDAGLFQTLGHSIGMAIGAQVARPGQRVLSLIGDGGFGIAGMDMETMVRYGLPAVVVLFNNASWAGRAWGHDRFYPERTSGALSRVRYDDMFKAVGCHTEHVTDPDDIRGALERSFESGKPALIDVVGETDTTSPLRARVNLLDTWSRGNFDRLPEETREEMRGWPKSVFERAVKRSRDNLFGEPIPLEELTGMVGVEFED